MWRAIYSVCLLHQPCVCTLLTAAGYFEVLHPVYPFLDKSAFEEKAASSDLLQELKTDFAFCGLYYAVLAIGCQYNGLSSFIPDDNRAWKFFRIALSQLDRILMSLELLPSLQVCSSHRHCHPSSNHVDCTIQAITAMVRRTFTNRSLLTSAGYICHKRIWP
jgi:hypothetical protein